MAVSPWVMGQHRPVGSRAPQPCWSKRREHPGAGGAPTWGQHPKSVGRHVARDSQSGTSELWHRCGAGGEFATSQGGESQGTQERLVAPQGTVALSHTRPDRISQGDRRLGGHRHHPSGIRENKQQQVFALVSWKKWGHARTGAVNHHHAGPAARAGMGTGMGMCPHHPQPLPCSPAARGTAGDRGRAEVLPCQGGASTLGPAACLDAAPAGDGAMPGPIPAPGRAVVSAPASGV